MIRILQILFAGIITDFALFPATFTFFPVVNTKMVLAIFGFFLYLYDRNRFNQSEFPQGFVTAFIWAVVVSFIGFFSTIINDAGDYTYATYVVSMLVWCASSYVAVRVIMVTEGECNVRVVANYIIGVCVAQCILAMAIKYVPWVGGIVDSLSTDYYARDHGRLYGFSCSLDVAGTRFASCLVMLSVLIVSELKTGITRAAIFYFIAMVVIVVIGNMIARTTIIGVIFLIAYWIYVSVRKKENSGFRVELLWRSLIIVSIIAVGITVYQYNTDKNVQEDIRFAFEGFFSLVEKGEWQTTSNDRLATMVVFPETLKTWIIGDGYFNNPLDENPYFIGKGIGSYYMNTDIGYLRFIFYFGLIGTAAFCIYFWQVAKVCATRFVNYKAMFYMLLLLCYAIWFKVSTDIFVVFSFFLMIPDFSVGYDEKGIKEKRL